MVVKSCRKAGLYFCPGGISMLEAQFYFLSDQYYLDFPDDKLMKNKDMIDGSPHKRPCFFTFPDSQIPDIYWIVDAAIPFVSERYLEEIQLS